MLGILYPIAFLFVVLAVIRLYKSRHSIARDKLARQEKILQPCLQPKADLEDRGPKERENARNERRGSIDGDTTFKEGTHNRSVSLSD